MGVSAKELFNKTKERWEQQSKKKKIGIISIVAAVLLIALGITLILNLNKSGYVVLYSNLDSSEVSQIYSAVQDLGVNPRLNSRGEIEVPKEAYDQTLLQLAAQGFPESAMPYNVFFDHSSITATESDKQTALLFQLQDRIQTTLESIDAVRNAKVTLTLAEDSNYVWQQATSENTSTGSVLLTLNPGKTLSAEQVSAIKNLVAAATPKLVPENVTVLDSTGMELMGVEEGNSFANSTGTVLEFEQAYQNMLEQNVKKLLVPRYGTDGVVVSARVTLDFDKIMQERKEILKQEDGTETPSHIEHEATINGTEAVGGIVGEEDNTDIPTYGQTDPEEEGGSTYYRDSVDFEYGYLLEQVERDNATISQSSISVYVDDGQVQNNQYDLVEQISNSTGIPQENISVASLNPGAVEEQQEPTPSFFEQNKVIIISGAAILGVILIIIAVVILLLRRRAKRLEEEREAELASQALEVEEELEEYKQKLEDAARANSDSKERVITDEVRNFAKENPEITASLLRSWLKED